MTRDDDAPRDRRTRLRDVLRFDFHGALLPVPALALLLVGGILMGRPLTAGIAAGAAFSVGFGATKRFWHRRGSAMAVTSVGMTIVAFLGTLAGNDPTVELAATIAMGFVSGGFVRYDTTLWWAWLQIVIAFLLAAHFPGSPLDALHRGLLVATGAALQCLLVPLAARIIGEASIIAGRDGARPARREIALHAFRAGACIAIASLAAKAVGVAHGYWAPMTAMLVLKPGLRDTGWRGVDRVTGTVAGIALATGLLHIFPPVPLLLAIVSVVSAGLAFGLQRARYAVLSTAITASVLFMIALAGGAVIDADYDRLAATLIGGTVALVGASLAPGYPRWMRRNGDNE